MTIILTVPAHVWAKDNCNTLMTNFLSSDKALTKEDRLDLAVCRTACEKMPNTERAREYCGLEECQMQVVETGNVNNWCCNMAKIWGNKLGSKSNPLESILSYCKKPGPHNKDLMACIQRYNNSGELSDSCCSQLSDIKKYDQKFGEKATSICSQRRSAAACKAQYANKSAITAACCKYAEANNGKILGTKYFQGEQEFAKVLEYGAKYVCKQESRKTSKEYESCKKNLKENKTLNDDCCIAFYNGELIPNKDKIDYTTIDKHCFPENYSE